MLPIRFEWSYSLLGEGAVDPGSLTLQLTGKAQPGTCQKRRLRLFFCRVPRSTENCWWARSAPEIKAPLGARLRAFRPSDWHPAQDRQHRNTAMNLNWENEVCHESPERSTEGGTGVQVCESVWKSQSNTGSTREAGSCRSCVGGRMHDRSSI